MGILAAVDSGVLGGPGHPRGMEEPGSGASASWTCCAQGPRGEPFGGLGRPFSQEPGGVRPVKVGFRSDLIPVGGRLCPL